MDNKYIKYQNLYQLDINKLFLKAVKSDNVDLVKYLLFSNDLKCKAQLKITKQTGYVNEDKEGFVPLFLAVQNNAMKVSKFFLQEIDWFSTLSYDAKKEVLRKSIYPNNNELFKLVVNEFRRTTQIKDFYKPYLFSDLLDVVIEKNAKNIYTELMTWDNYYKENVNKLDKDSSFLKAVTTNADMLDFMLKSEQYKSVSHILFLNAFKESRYHENSALILYEYGIRNNIFNISLSSYKKIDQQILKDILTSHSDKLIQKIHNDYANKSEFKNWLNSNTNDYFETLEDAYKSKIKTYDAKVFEYVYKNNLLNEQSLQEILKTTIRVDYKCIMEIMAKYPTIMKDYDLNEHLDNVIMSSSQGKCSLEKLDLLLELDVNKKLDISIFDFEIFTKLESKRNLSSTEEKKELIQKILSRVVLEYNFNPTKELKESLKKNDFIFNLLNKKELSNKLNQLPEKEIQSKKAKI